MSEIDSFRCDHSKSVKTKADIAMSSSEELKTVWGISESTKLSTLSVTPPVLPKTVLCTPGLDTVGQFVKSAPEDYYDCVAESDCNFIDSCVSKFKISESNFVPVLETSLVCVSGLANVPGDYCTPVPIKLKTVCVIQEDCKVLINSTSGNFKDTPAATVGKVAKDACSSELANSKPEFSFPELTFPRQPVITCRA